jgi:hypothetical protein
MWLDGFGWLVGFGWLAHQAFSDEICLNFLSRVEEAWSGSGETTASKPLCLGAQHTCLAEPNCTASARALQQPRHSLVYSVI